MSQTTLLSPDDPRWLAISQRDKAQDGQFVYGVASTRIYCRPSCPSRLPRRENVRLFELPAQAEAAGFRACKRCQPRQMPLLHPHSALVQEMADYLRDHADQPAAWTSEALVAHFHYDASTLSERFKQALGLTPRQYAEAWRVEGLKQQLQAQPSATEAIFQAGYTSLSQVYERANEQLGMTPAALQRRGAGVALRAWGQMSAYGHLLVAVTARGVAFVGLYDSAEEAESALRASYPQASIQQDEAMQGLIDAIVGHLEGQPAPDLALDIQATAFRWRVWHELQRIPRGQTRSYAQIAHAIGQPQAVRAVANACANNLAAILIPCHRVIGSDGALHGYRWGMARKRQLLEREAR